MAKHRIVLDCDPGIDDAIALLLALSAPDEITLHSVTTVCGNRPLATTTRNALRILALAGRKDVPVYPGCARAILPGPTTDQNVHGNDGLGDVGLPDTAALPAGEHAVRHLIDTVQEYPGEITICAIGPMTNIALAMIQEPGIIEKIREIVFMGGAAFVPGNTTDRAEFNIWSDPHAAQVVLSSGVPLTMFGLDVTRRARFSREWLAALEQAARSPVTAASIAMLRQYFRGDPCLHDPCVIAHLIDPTLFAAVDVRVDVECSPGPAYGQTVATKVLNKGPSAVPGNCRVITQVENERLLALLAQKLTRQALLLANPG